MRARHGFFVGTSSSSVQSVFLLTEAVSRTHARLAGFIAISVAVHLLTVLGIGPLDLSARRVGDASTPLELHATLAPGERAEAGAALSREGNETETARDAGPEISRGGNPEPPGAAAAEAGLALLAPDKWYTAREVDVRAQPLTEVRLRYPEELRSQPVVGRVHLRLFIDERGVVRRIQVAVSEPGGLFDEAAKQAWEDVKFSPALKNGTPVKSQKLLELTYHPGLM